MLKFSSSNTPSSSTTEYIIYMIVNRETSFFVFIFHATEIATKSEY